jgi:uncharacterized protein with HEPN domain
LTASVRPDRHALLELRELLREIADLRAQATGDRFEANTYVRWVLHRLWIAAGNEALAYTTALGKRVRGVEAWSSLYDLRNHLAHARLPDVDEVLVRRFTWARVDGYRERVDRLLTA